MVIIGLFLFVGMLFTASLALDMARYEQERARIQGIADRAVLAAANMRTSGDGAVSAEQFIRGYFLSEGVTPEELENWIVVEGDGVNDRAVTIRPGGRMNTMLMTLIGVDSLPLAAPARAEVSAGMPLEVVLVLDISGSMARRTSNGLSRLDNLKVAANEMVADLMRDRREGDVAITIVPYDRWVVSASNMLTYMNIDEPQASGVQRGWHCYEMLDWQLQRDDWLNIGGLPNGLLNLPGLNIAPGLLRNVNARVNAVRNSITRPVARRDCGTMYGFRVVRPLMTNQADITAVINSLQPLGTTSIDLGIVSGAMFFDTSLRPYVNDQITAGNISPTMRGRPAGVDDQGVMRVMVVMTDGENCCQGGRPVFSTNIQPADMDQNASAVCRNLRAEGILVFAVAFEAPSRGRDLMSDCASSPSHFFNTNGAGLSETFRAIGRQINAQSLRLTL